MCLAHARGVTVQIGERARVVAVTRKIDRDRIDARRVEVLPSGVLLLEQISQILGQPLQIGKGGLREGVILELLSDPEPDAAAA